MRSVFMTTKRVLAMFMLLLCSACTVSVAPIATPSGTLNLEDKSITESHSGVAFTVKHDELSVAPYAMVDNITSFYVTIDNRTVIAVSFPPRRFCSKMATAANIVQSLRSGSGRWSARMRFT